MPAASSAGTIISLAEILLKSRRELAEAREKRDAARKLLASGISPTRLQKKRICHRRKPDIQTQCHLLAYRKPETVVRKARL